MREVKEVKEERRGSSTAVSPDLQQLLLWGVCEHCGRDRDPLQRQPAAICCSAELSWVWISWTGVFSSGHVTC